MSRIDELMAEVLGIPENFNYTECGAPTPTKEVELNADCAPVCRACYLKNIPEEDIQGILHDAEVSLADPN